MGSSQEGGKERSVMTTSNFDVYRMQTRGPAGFPLTATP